MGKAEPRGTEVSGFLYNFQIRLGLAVSMWVIGRTQNSSCNNFLHEVITPLLSLCCNSLFCSGLYPSCPFAELNEEEPVPHVRQDWLSSKNLVNGKDFTIIFHISPSKHVLEVYFVQKQLEPFSERVKGN